MKKIILASKSPRRKELVQKLGLTCEIIPSDFDENMKGKKFTYELINSVSKNKALAVAKNLKENAIVIGADTVVVLEDEIFLKPTDEQDAYNELRKLSGKTHEVITSITVIDTQTQQTETEATTSKVTFQNLSDEQIWNYIKTKKPLDKAGAYGIQELDNTFVKSLNGSKDNVIGLDTESLKRLILKLDKNLSLY